SAGGAVGRAELRFAAQNVAADERGDDVVCSIGRKEDRAAVLLINDRRFAQRHERVERGFGILQKFFARGKLFDFGHGPGGSAAKAHAVGSLSGGAELHGVNGLAVARDGALGVEQVVVDDREARVGGDGLNVGIRAVKIAGGFQRFLPGVGVYFERKSWFNQLDGTGFGEIVDGIFFFAELL